MAGSERFPAVVHGQSGSGLEKHGIPDEHIVMRVTGCPEQ